MTNRYVISATHHSISRSREVRVGGTLDHAKRVARREFGDDFREYTICIYTDTDGPSEMIASRSNGERNWYHY